MLALPPTNRLYRRAALFWLVLFALAFANGALRELVLTPRLGAVARPLSALTLIILLGVAAAWFIRRTAPPVSAAWRVGLMWLVLTLMAEVLLGIATGRLADVARSFTWEAVAAGNLFAPAVIFLAVAPALFAWTQRKR